MQYYQYDILHRDSKHKEVQRRTNMDHSYLLASVSAHCFVSRSPG